jgi:hypothetical protein
VGSRAGLSLDLLRATAGALRRANLLLDSLPMIFQAATGGSDLARFRSERETPCLERIRMAAAERLCAVLLACVASYAFGQGTITVLNTGSGQPLVTGERTVNVSSNLPQPQLQFSFGFATDETVVPNKLMDSFTVTIQDTNGARTAILLTSDASGTVLAPVSPGTVVIDPGTISLTPIPYPSLNPLLANRQAFQASAAIPGQFLSGPINVFFDLFDNQDALASQGWFSDPRVAPVPEPQPWVLGVLAALTTLGLRRRGWPSEGIAN